MHPKTCAANMCFAGAWVRLNETKKRGARSEAETHYIWGQDDGCNTGVICH
jgi:hypothetical protein